MERMNEKDVAKDAIDMEECADCGKFVAARTLKEGSCEECR